MKEIQEKTKQIMQNKIEKETHDGKEKDSEIERSDVKPKKIVK